MTIVTKATSMKDMTMKAITTTATILKPYIRKAKHTPMVEVMRLSFRQPKLKQPA